MSAESDPQRDGDLFRFYNERLGADAWQSGSWQDAFVDRPPETDQDGWPAPEPDGGDYGRELFGGPGADLFGSGPPARESGGGLRWDGERGIGPPSGSMPAISQSMPPLPQSAPPPQPEQPVAQQPAAQQPAAQQPAAQQPPAQPVAAQPPPAQPPVAQQPAVQQPASPAPQPAPSGAPQPLAAQSLAGQQSARQQSAGQADESEEINDAGSLVRPYARTGGRTRTDYDLAIETLVSTSEQGRAQSNPATPEHRSICGLCTDARSVAEVSAHLRLPLGVVRVLIGDMADLGLVLIHDSGMVVGDRPSMQFLERVLSGLRRL